MISNTLWLRKRAQKLLSPNARYPLTSTHPHQQSPPSHINGHYHHLARQRITTCWPHSLSKFFFVSFFSLNAIITSTSIRVHPRPSPAPIHAHPHLSPPASITFPHPCPSVSVTTRPPSVPIRVHRQLHPPPLHSPTLKVSPTTMRPCPCQPPPPILPSSMFYFILSVALLTVTTTTATTCVQRVRTHIQVSIILQGTHYS